MKDAVPKPISNNPEFISIRLNDSLAAEVNDGFYVQIYNTLGFTVRGPFDGGDIEHNRAAKFYETAEKIQVMYPITAGIYRDLGTVYSNDANRYDTEAVFLKLDN